MLQRPAASFALARADGLLIERVGPEAVIYDGKSREAHCLSPIAAAVFEGADGHTGVEDLAAHAGSATGEHVVEAQVEAALAQLEESGLLVTPADGLSRRQLVRRTAAVTATVAAAPMVTSIVTPAHAQTSPRLNCPNSKCSSQSEGDTWCACINTCPSSTKFPNVSNCTPFDGSPAPFYGSCECLRCPRTQSPTDQGQFQNCVEPPGCASQPGGCAANCVPGEQLGFQRCEALYGDNYWMINKNGQDTAQNWNPNWPEVCTGAHVANNRQFGCAQAGGDRRIDGGCFNEPGDTSQAGLGLICE